MKKCRLDETKERYKELRSLRTALTLFVFFIFITAGIATFGIAVLFYKLRLIPHIINTPIILPLITIFVCMMIGTVLSAFVGKLVINPLRRLIAANEQIKSGNYAVRVNEHTYIGELNNLMHSFNSMARELESTELFRNDFINNFSHEFKTPIVSIKGFARQLQKDNEQHLLTDGQRCEYTDIIAYEADRLTKLSSNILLLNKFENQQIVSDRTDFYLDEQIRRIVLILEKQWSTRNIEPVLELDEMMYRFNEEMLAQVWLNLIGNAIKFSPDGGKIFIRCRQKDHSVIVTVTDNGEGIAPENLHKIFDKFYQMDTSHKSEGNGLGLAIVKRIVELAGGEVSVKSELGKGSTFKVVLPTDIDQGVGCNEPPQRFFK